MVGSSPPDIPFSLIALGLSREERTARIQDAEARLALETEAEGPGAIGILTELADLYTTSGALTAALELRERAVVYARRLYGTNAPETLAQMISLADSYHTFARYDSAETFVRFALDHLTPDADAQKTRLCGLEVLGSVYQAHARYTEAEQTRRDALALAHTLYGLDHPTTAGIAHAIALTLQQMVNHSLLSSKKEAEAQTLGENALEILRRTLGGEHPETIIVGWSVETKGGDAAASKLRAEWSLRVLEERLGPNQQWTLSAVQRVVKYAPLEEKVALYERVLQGREAVFGANHPLVAFALQGLANFYREQGKISVAEPLMRRAVAIDKAVQENHPTTAYHSVLLAIILSNQGKWTEAEPFLRQAIDIYEHFGLSNSRFLAEALIVLAQGYRQRGKPKPADSLLRWALQVVENAEAITIPQDQAVDAGLVLRIIGDNLLDQKRFDEAERTYQRALATLEARYGKESRELSSVLCSLGSIHAHCGDFDQARTAYERAIPLLERERHPDDPALEAVLSDLAIVCHHSEQYEDAERLLRRAFHLSESRRGLLDPYTAEVVLNLSVALSVLGRQAEAEEMEYLGRSIQANVESRGI